MRLLLKTTEGHVKMYWVELQSNSITGWFCGEWIRNELGLPNNLHFDSHFTYPNDGSFHFSYKSINVEREEFVSVFYDKVRIKTIVKDRVIKIEKTREQFYPTILQHFVPDNKLAQLSEIQHYQFPTLGFNVFNGTFNFKKIAEILLEEEDIRSDDLVVDVSELVNSIVNIYATIRSSNQNHTKEGSTKWFFKSLPLSNSRTLDLICSVAPKKQN